MTRCVMVRAEEQHGSDYNHLEQSGKKTGRHLLERRCFPLHRQGDMVL